MIKLKSVCFFVLALGSISLTGAGTAFASSVCKKGPNCSSLRGTVESVKQIKKKRHNDVVKFGRKSAEVKADDQALELAAQEDRGLREERQMKLVQNEGKSGGKPKLGKKSGRKRCQVDYRHGPKFTSRSGGRVRLS